jgi:pyridoxine 5-phosphate synthase
MQALTDVVKQIKKAGVRVSLFMDPDPEAITQIAATRADRIELYTEPYARAFAEGRGQESFALFSAAALRAQELGMGVNAGHDLNLENLTLFRSLPGLLEVSIGHALTADALLLGWELAIQKYLQTLK